MGFSSTSYYIKFFKKWFGHTPEEYRKLYKPHILSDDRPPQIELLPDGEAINLIRQCMSAVSDQEKSPSVIDRVHMTVDVDPNKQAIMQKQHSLEVVITHEDYHVMGERLFNLLYELKASKVIIACRQGDSETTTSLIANRLSFIGYEVSTIYDDDSSSVCSAGYDSIAEAINIFRTYFTTNENTLNCRLRDQGDPLKILKGSPSCITSCFVPKPSFYAYRLLKNIKGELLYWGKHYYVIKNKMSEKESYTFVVLNYNEDILHLCLRNAGVYEANDIINSFKDELHLDFSIPVEPGQYVVAKYALSNSNSIFGHMSNLAFPESFPLPESWANMLNTETQAQVSIENIDDNLIINSSIKGAGINIIVVEKVRNTN